MKAHDYATLPFVNAHTIDDAIRGATEERKNNIVINIDDVKDLKIIYDANRVMVSRGKAPMATTFHSFGQLCQLTQCPTGFMRELEGLAVDVLNQRLTPGDKAQFIVYKVSANEGVLRGITSQTYGRIWTLNILRSIEQQLHQATSQYDLYFNLRQSERADTHIEIVGITSREVEGMHGKKQVNRARLIRNSETGGRSASIDDLLVTETGQRFIIEGVEANRTYRHTMNALQRFQMGLNESMMRFSAPDFEQELFREAARRVAGNDYEIAVGYAEQVCGMELPEIHVNKTPAMTCCNLRIADLLAEATMGTGVNIDRKYELATAAGMMLTAPDNPRPDYDLRKAKIAALQQGRKQRSVQASRNRRAMKSMHGQLNITPTVKP